MDKIHYKISKYIQWNFDTSNFVYSIFSLSRTFCSVLNFSLYGIYKITRYKSNFLYSNFSIRRTNIRVPFELIVLLFIILDDILVYIQSVVIITNLTVEILLSISRGPAISNFSDQSVKIKLSKFYCIYIITTFIMHSSKCMSRRPLQHTVKVFIFANSKFCEFSKLNIFACA